MSRSRWNSPFSATVTHRDLAKWQVTLTTVRGNIRTETVAPGQPLDRLPTFNAISYQFAVDKERRVVGWAPQAPGRAALEKLLRSFGLPATQARRIGRNVNLDDFAANAAGVLAATGCDEHVVDSAERALPAGLVDVAGTLLGAGANAKMIYNVFDRLRSDRRISPAEYVGWLEEHCLDLDFLEDIGPVSFETLAKISTADGPDRIVAALQCDLLHHEHYDHATCWPMGKAFARVAAITGVDYATVAHIVGRWKTDSGIWVEGVAHKRFYFHYFRHTEPPVDGKTAFVAYKKMGYREAGAARGLWCQANRPVTRRLGRPGRPDGLDLVQAEVAEAISRHRIVTVLGAAGTGKTHTVRKSIDHLGVPDSQIGWTATTGRAAQHLHPQLGTTLHSFLGVAPGSFLHNTDRQVAVLVVDEASMLDVHLAAPLGSYLAAGMAKHVVFVGDPYQLPPVGAGRYLWDLTTPIGPSHETLTLNQVHRTRRSGILALSEAIRHHKPLPELARLAGVDHLHIPPGRGASSDRQWSKAVGAVADLVKADPTAMVITPGYQGRSGIVTLNRAIRRAVLGDSDDQWMVGERVVQLQNMRIDNGGDEEASLLANGTFGVITSLDDTTITVAYDTGVSHTWERRMCTGSRQSLILPAYALSVHRAQGQQADTVVVICDPDAPAGGQWADRAMGYTAVTRAVKRLVVVGDPNMLVGSDPGWAVGVDDVSTRITAFNEIIAQLTAKEHAA